jgi:hypothetical protein
MRRSVPHWNQITPRDYDESQCIQDDSVVHRDGASDRMQPEYVSVWRSTCRSTRSGPASPGRTRTGSGRTRAGSGRAGSSPRTRTIASLDCWAVKPVGH